MTVRRTRRTAATAEVTEEVITVETRSKRTRAAPRKAAAPKAPKSAKETAPSSRAEAQPVTRSDTVASTPATTTNKRRLRSTTEADSPLRALDQEPPAKRTRTTTRKAQPATPTPRQPQRQTQPSPEEEDDEEEEIPVFFQKSEPLVISYPSRLSTLIESSSTGFEAQAREILIGTLRSSIAELEAANAVLRAENDGLNLELSRSRACLFEVENELARTRNELEHSLNRDLDEPSEYFDAQTSPVQANTTTPEFDSFDVDQSEPVKPSFMTGDESAIALLRHVQEAAKCPISSTSPKAPPATTSPTYPVAETTNSPLATSPAAAETAAATERPSTPNRGLFSSLTSPFTTVKSWFGSSTTHTPAPVSPTPPTPTPSRRPAPDTITEVLTMPPTPVGERSKTPSKKPKKQSRFFRALIKGVDPADLEKATAWVKLVETELPSTGNKRKRLEALETPVLLRDLKHFPASKPWQSGFSFPEDVLDLEDDDVVPAWAVYTSLIEEQQQENLKRVKTVHPIDPDWRPYDKFFQKRPKSETEMHPRRSTEPSPMFNTPLQHQESSNVFKELHDHDTATSDRETMQRELKAGGVQFQNEPETRTFSPSSSIRKAHDPTHGSFSVPDSDSEEEEETQAQPVWTQAPPPAPTPAHSALPQTQTQTQTQPQTNHNEEIERQRQKLMKHTPHKPSRLQQVSYPSPSLMSDAGESPLKVAPEELFGNIPEVEPLDFSDDPEIAAIMASPEYAARLDAMVKGMNWSAPYITYDSDEEEISPVSASE